MKPYGNQFYLTKKVSYESQKNSDKISKKKITRNFIMNNYNFISFKVKLTL